MASFLHAVIKFCNKAGKAIVCGSNWLFKESIIRNAMVINPASAACDIKAIILFRLVAQASIDDIFMYYASLSSPRSGDRGEAF